MERLHLDGYSARMKAMFVLPIPPTDCSHTPVKLGEGLSYRIRVVCRRELFEVQYAVGAIRCGRSEDIEYLSTFSSDPRDAVKQMNEGFALRENASPAARKIAEQVNQIAGTVMRRAA